MSEDRLVDELENRLDEDDDEGDDDEPRVREREP